MSFWDHQSPSLHSIDLMSLVSTGDSWWPPGCSNLIFLWSCQDAMTSIGHYLDDSWTMLPCAHLIALNIFLYSFWSSSPFQAHFWQFMLKECFWHWFWASTFVVAFSCCREMIYSFRSSALSWSSYGTYSFPNQLGLVVESSKSSVMDPASICLEQHRLSRWLDQKAFWLISTYWFILLSISDSLFIIEITAPLWLFRLNRFPLFARAPFEVKKLQILRGWDTFQKFLCLILSSQQRLL